MLSRMVHTITLGGASQRTGDCNGFILMLMISDRPEFIGLKSEGLSNFMINYHLFWFYITSIKKQKLFYLIFDCYELSISGGTL